MPEPGTGFAIDLDEARKAADVSLPNLAQHLRGPAQVLFSHEGLHGPGGYQPAVQNVQRVYAEYTDVLGHRLLHGCEKIDATANALREIVRLYMRADGRG